MNGPPTTMRLAPVLAIATVVLAASTLYLAREFHAERARNATSGASLPPVGLNSPGASVDGPRQPNHVDVANVSRLPSASPLTDEEPQSGRTQLDAVQVADLRRRLDEFNNPAMRAQRVSDMRTAIKPMVDELASNAELQPHEAERVHDAMAESMVRGQHRSVECQLIPGCSMRTDARVRAREDYQEFEQAVGAETLRRVETSESLQRVQAFGSTLPEAHALSGEAANALAIAVTAERRRWVETEEPLSVLNQRLHARAAAILTAEQLTVFSRKQDEMFRLD